MAQKKNAPKKNLVLRVVLKFGVMYLIIALIFFIPAGSIAYWNGWLFMGTLVIPALFVFFYLARKDPALLEKRMQFREKEKEQKWFIKISTSMILVGFLVPGLDYRFGWSSVPVWLVLVATAVVLGGFALFFAVVRQNSFASRVIEIQKGQKLIDTGLYSVVRHPMYMATTMIYIAMPLVLGSFYALIPIVLFLAFMPVRILNEEKILMKGLKGYKQYMKKVRYRVIPFVW